MQLSFFPSRSLALYVGRTFLIRCAAVLAMLVVVLTTLDLLGQTSFILAHPGNGEAELWRYVGLRVPQIIARFLPFSVLLGTIITLAAMNQNSEIISMKAAGLSAHQILAPLMIVAIGIAGISFAFNERIVTRASSTLKIWHDVDYGPIPRETGVKMNVWVRDGNNLLRAGVIGGSGDSVKLRLVENYVRVDNMLTTVIRAPRGYYDAQKRDWVLVDALVFDVARGTARQVARLRVAPDIRPDQFTLARVDGDSLSFVALGRAIRDLRDAGRPTAELEAAYWHKFSGPLSALLMPLLGAVSAFGIARSGHLFIRAVMGMALGFTYFVADNFALAMGNLGAYPPFLAAWAPFVLFFLLGETVLMRTEE